MLAELPGRPGPAGQLGVTSRVGVRIYLDVGTGGEPASDFEVSTLTPQRRADGTPVVTAQVTNTGGRALDLSGTLTLSDGPGGLSAGPFPVDVRTVGVRRSADVAVALSKELPAGPWRARLQLRSGPLQKASEATLTFPTGASTVGTPAQARDVPLAQDPSVVIPVAGGLILLVLLGLLLFLLWRRRRDRDEDEAPVDAPVDVLV